MMRAETCDYDCLMQRVFAYRMTNNLSQVEFAEKAKVAVGVIRKLEQGRFPLSKNSIFKIEHAMKED